MAPTSAAAAAAAAAAAVVAGNASRRGGTTVGVKKEAKKEDKKEKSKEALTSQVLGKILRKLRRQDPPPVSVSTKAIGDAIATIVGGNEGWLKNVAYWQDSRCLAFFRVSISRPLALLENQRLVPTPLSPRKADKGEWLRG